MIGIAAFGLGTMGMWLALLAAVVGGSWVGWFLGGIVSLQTPRPGEEPFGSAPGDDGQVTSEAIRVRPRRRSGAATIAAGRQRRGVDT